MIQNRTDSPFNLFVDNQVFNFLIDGKERAYGSFKYTYGETENDPNFFPGYYNYHYMNGDLVDENSKELLYGAYYSKSVTSSRNTPAEGIEFILRPFGTYDKTGMKRKDLVILKFRYAQSLSMASKKSIWQDGKEILEGEIIPIKVDVGEYGSGSVNIRLNGKLYRLSVRNGWSGLPFLEDKALHDEIKLNPEIQSISNWPNWRGFERDYSYTLHSLRRDFLKGKDHATIGCNMVAKKQALDDALRLANEVSKKSNYEIDGQCSGETSVNLFKAYREYHACLVAGEEKNKVMGDMVQLEMTFAEVY